MEAKSYLFGVVNRHRIFVATEVDLLLVDLRQSCSEAKEKFILRIGLLLMDHDDILDPSSKSMETFLSISFDGIFIDSPFVFLLWVDKQALKLNLELLPIIFDAVFEDVARCGVQFDWQPLFAEEL